MFHPQGPTFFELAKQALSSTERGYDLLAPKFDFTPFRTPDKVLSVVQAHLGSREKVDTSLDLCCGTGAGMEVLSTVTRQQVTGIDFSQGMLAQAEKNLAHVEKPSQGFEFRFGDVLKMEDENAFDLAVCFGAFGHILPKDEDAFVERIAQALRPGGRFVFVTSISPPWYEPGRWMAHGFNAAMVVRNMLIKPPFIMYYLTFLWPKIEPILERHGMKATVHESFKGAYRLARLVEATKEK